MRMKQLNVSISDWAYGLAKVAADKDGMMLRKWVERAICDAAKAPHEPLEVARKQAAELPEDRRRIVPIEDL